MTQQSWGSPQWGANPQPPSWGPPQGAAWPGPAGQPWPAQLAAQPGYAQPYYQAPGGYPPPKRSGGLRTVIIAAIAAIVVLGVVGTLWSLMSDKTDYAGPNPTRTTPAPAPTKTTAAQPTKTTTAQPTKTTGAQPTTAPTTAAQPTKAPTTAPTQAPPEPTTPPPAGTEVPPPDTNPSDLPAPDTYDEATKWMKENPVYAQSVAVPTDCAVGRVDAATASSAELEKHLNETAACLWRVWSPPLVAAGFEMPRPPVTVYSSVINTACGKVDDPINAFYCPANQHIYFGKLRYLSLPPELRKVAFMADLSVAHEFGHAIQARTGILISEAQWQSRESTTKEEAMLFSRRTEVQADCLAGEFVGSVAAANKLTATDLQNLGKTRYASGDDISTGDPNFVGDHGSGKSRQAWFTAGLTNNQLTTCNSFTVPAAKVR